MVANGVDASYSFPLNARNGSMKSFNFRYYRRSNVIEFPSTRLIFSGNSRYYELTLPAS